MRDRQRRTNPQSSHGRGAPGGDRAEEWLRIRERRDRPRLVESHRARAARARGHLRRRLRVQYEPEWPSPSGRGPDRGIEENRFPQAPSGTLGMPGLTLIQRQAHVAAGMLAAALFGWAFLIWAVMDMQSPLARLMMPVSPAWA